jgi:hypothetical protein
MDSPNGTTFDASYINARLADLEQHRSAPRAAMSGRAPVHVLYGGAHLFSRGAPAKLAALANAAMHTWGADSETFARCVGAAPADATELHRRVQTKLATQPIEAMCIDFEDGYGPRPDEEEDADAVRAATELAAMTTPNSVHPALVGIRIKSLSTTTAARAIRTLDLFLTNLVRSTGGAVPEGFSVTLPKASHPHEVSTLATMLATLVPNTKIGIELMVETPAALIDAHGRIALPALVDAADGRCTAVHLGAYDLTASLGVAAHEQRLDHPACELARLLMQVSLAHSGVSVVDGATTILPLPRHKPKDGTALSDNEAEANRRAVQSAWTLHASGIRHALTLGIYRGWDLHPAQLPARYGATYAYFLAARETMASRLRAFVDKSFPQIVKARAT